MTRFCAALLVALVAFASPAVAVAQDDEIPDECRTIVGCPDAGPEPEHSGDRGGWAQLLTLGVLVVAVAFILTKVIGSARATQAARAPDQSGS